MFESGLMLFLIPALPLAAAILTAVLGPRFLRSKSHWPTVAAVAGSCFFSLLLLAEVQHQQNRAPQAESTEPGARTSIGYERTFTLWRWAQVVDAYKPSDSVAQAGASDVAAIRDFSIDITLRADALTAMMLAMVTFVSTLVAVYSIGYMHDDQGYWRFFSYISLFVFSMTMLVSVNNFLLLYVFWEAVGACSYLLIGFWYQKPEAAAAGKKAFLVNRVGDFGFALGLFLLWTTYGTLNYHDTQREAAAASSGAAAVGAVETSTHSAELVPGVLGQTRLRAGAYVGGLVGLAICLLLLVGACGKSAQFPLHVWLPDAMEGPTPVSALIHAATMVTAGVYMVTRCTPLFLASPEAQLVMAVIGGFTALLTALIALTQFDLKRVLAYSTISQLGYMFLGLGTGTLVGIGSGMFHLLTHAFFKALLFLGAGSVMHAMGGVIDMRRFSGLRRVLPITCITFALGCVALSGVPPLAGFFSKDAILHAVLENAHSPLGEVGTDGHAAPEPATTLSPGLRARVYHGLYCAALFTAFLTAFYTFRAFFLTFFGRQSVPHEAGHHAHESPGTMWAPLAVLAVCACLVGPFGEAFAGFLRHTPSLAAHADVAALAAGHAPHHSGNSHLQLAVISTLVALSGVGLAAFLYLGDRREIEWLTWLMTFQALKRVPEIDWVASLRRLGWVSAIDRGANAIGLGWLAEIVGYAVLLVLAILGSPILLGYYLSPYNLSQRKFYIDEIYAALIVWPLRLLADISYQLDRLLIDGLVNLCGWVPRIIGALMRTLQMGLVPFYALAMVLGMLVLAAARILFAGG